MTTTEFLQEINDALRGTDDDAPAFGTSEASYWIRTGQRVRRNLYKNTKLQLGSTYSVLSLGTISAATAPSFDLDDTFLSPSDSCYVIGTTNHRTDFTIIKPQEKDYTKQQVFIAGADPQVLYFTKEIVSTDNIVGGTLYLPCFVLPDEFGSSATDTVVVDDPDWLVLATATEIAFNDITYEDKSADLNAKANALYDQMTSTNRRGTHNNPRKSTYNVPRISGF